MKRTSVISLLLLFSALVLTNCETPSAPKFQVENKVDISLLKPKRFYFMGDSNAFIDTTKGKFDTLFTRGSNGVVHISFKDSVNLGDLDDAIPAIDVEPSTIESEVGSIEIDDFSADFSSEIGAIEQGPQSASDSEVEIGNIQPEFSGSGASSFEEVTGIPAPGMAVPISEGNTTIFIDLDAGAFNSAVIESGGLRLTFTNQLGFDISSAIVRLRRSVDTNPTRVGNRLDIFNLNHTNTSSEVILFQNGDLLEVPLQVEIELTWVAQTYQPNAFNALDVSLQEEALSVSEAAAEIPSQSLTPDPPTIEISDPGFVSVIMTNNPSPSVNRLILTLENKTAIPLSNADLNNFPLITIRNSDGTILDEPKRIAPASPSTIFLESNETAVVSFNLNGVKLTKVLSVDVDLGTPGSQGTTATVKSTDSIIISATTTDLEVDQANAIIDPQSDISLSDEAGVDGDFVRAEIEEGNLTLTFTNTLPIPINLQTLSIRNKTGFTAKNTGKYFNAGSIIGELSNVAIPSNGTTSRSISLDGKGISNEIMFEGIANSPGSSGATVTMTQSDLIRVGVEGSISVSEAEARLKSQEFSSEDVFELENEDFEFNLPSHYIKLKGGTLVISNLINQLDVGLDTLRITVHDIKAPNNQALTLSFYGNTTNGTTFPRIERKENGTRAPIEIDLTDYRISAGNNSISYTVFGLTENTENSADPYRVIKSTDKVSATLAINNLEIQEALGKVVRKELLLGDDDESNGEDILDITNDNEAEVIDNDNLKDIREKLTNLNLSDTELSIQYTTNLGVRAAVIMAIAGNDRDGNLFFLQGKQSLAVTPADNVTKLYYNGVPIPNENLVKFTIGNNVSGPTGTYPGSISFNKDNSNVDQFLSELPTEIRTIGYAIINPDDAPNSFISNPIVFDTELSIDIPISLGTPDGPLSIDEDLGEIEFDKIIPADDKTASLSEFELTVDYKNQLPFGLNFQFEFLDADSALVNVNYQPLVITPAPTDANGFTSSPRNGKSTLRFPDLQQLRSVTQMRLKLEAETTERRNAKVRTNDFIEVSVTATSTGNTRVK